MGRAKKASEPQVTASNEAIAVAPPVEEAMSATVPDRVVVFWLGGERYALPLSAVQEIQQIVEPRPVPDASPALVGMIDVRGVVVPVIELRELLGLAPTEHGIDTPMVLAWVRGHLTALIVDEVDDVAELSPESLQPPSPMYALADRMIGIFRSGDDLVIILDPEKLVSEALAASARPVASGGEAG